MYRQTQNIPEWYDRVKQSPQSMWMTDYSNLNIVAEKVKEFFGNKPVIIKDFLKSQKHRWFDACFISSASDTEEVIRVTQNFIRLQEEFLEGGLVYREYLDLKKVGRHIKSRMLLSNEWRCFFCAGRDSFLTRYWTDGADYDLAEQPSTESIQMMVDGIDSRFFTADVAQKENGEWVLIEVGDGGASGLPDPASLNAFYNWLR